ncbi:hypothetical protein [Longispora albida]|uniref:hypothetical protein n=1 Tax=Longispora albida TaxID=203523 RepID=UPI000A00A623|nr:hypothetical protein [Longispora albida]
MTDAHPRRGVDRPREDSRRRSGPPRPAEEDSAEKGLRGLVGPGSSQVSVSAALRARDANRPTAEEMAYAEEHTQVVRRNWVPPEQLG